LAGQRTETLRIGADGSWMRWPSGGLSRYLDGLLHAMASARDPNEELIVYYNSARGASAFDEGVQERFARMPNRTLWNQLRLPVSLRKDRCDVYLAGAFVMPLAARIPCVTVIHDCTVFRDRAAKPGREGRYWRMWTRAAARRAAHIITVSSFVKRDCETLLGVDGARISVIHPGVAPAFAPPSDPERDRIRTTIADRYGIPSAFILHVGSDRHKGAAVAVEATRRLNSDGRSIGLVHCGPHASPGRVDALVTNLGRVDDAALVDLYRAASAVCVSSTQEGFGLPVLEALACGTPVVTTRTGGIPEAGGDAVVYSRDNGAESFAAAMASVLDSAPEEATARRTRGIEWAATFTWDRAARATLDVLRTVART